MPRASPATSSSRRRVRASGRRSRCPQRRPPRSRSISPRLPTPSGSPRPTPPPATTRAPGRQPPATSCPSSRRTPRPSNTPASGPARSSLAHRPATSSSPLPSGPRPTTPSLAHPSPSSPRPARATAWPRSSSTACSRAAPSISTPPRAARSSSPGHRPHRSQPAATPSSSGSWARRTATRQAPGLTWMPCWCGAKGRESWSRSAAPTSERRDRLGTRKAAP